MTPGHEAKAKMVVNPGNVLLDRHDKERQANGRFLLENNLWGQNDAERGYQKSRATGSIDDFVAWETVYEWVGGDYRVKSYANLDLLVERGKQIEFITSIPTSWHWRYEKSSRDLRANVAYDMWLSDSPDTLGATEASTFEIMVWLSARGGAKPARSKMEHETPLDARIGGTGWTMHKGKVKTWTVISFVAHEELNEYDGDLKLFLDYLVTRGIVPSNQYLVQVQGGTEAFIGSAKLITDVYAISVLSGPGCE